MIERRFVLDTNMIVSGLMFERSVPGQALDKVLDTGRPLLSGPILAEIVEVLGRKRLDRYVSRERRTQFLVTLVEKADFPEIQDLFPVCRDPKDNKFLELAVAGKASCLITGDRDLLVLDPFHGIPIVTPRRFLDEFPFNEGESAGDGS